MSDTTTQPRETARQTLLDNMRNETIFTLGTVVVVALIVTGCLARYVWLPHQMAAQNFCQVPLGGVSATMAMTWVPCSQAGKP